MIRSLYTTYVTDYPEPGKHLFYNTRTQALIVIDDALKTALENLPEIPTDPAAAGAFQTLLEMDFLVNDKSEDVANIEHYFKELKSGPKSLDAIVLTTFSCNFACTYCVEEGVKEAVHMDEETAEKTANYIVKQAKVQSAETVHVSFYGGEPLLNVRALKTVARSIREAAKNLDISFAFSITTNGVLLVPELVDELVQLGFEGVKLTIDGDQENHDAKRPFKNGKGSYNLIMENLKYAAQKVDIDLGGNFDEENSASFPRMLDQLEELGLKSRIGRITFKPIAETPEDRSRTPANAELECVYSRPGTAETMSTLRRELLNRGFATDPGIGVNICGITISGNHFTIDPQGKLYKCPALVGHEQFQVGDIKQGEVSQMGEKDLWRRCIDCENVPFCGDGCMYGAYIRYDDAMRLNCQREYVECLIVENLKTLYANTHRKTG